MRTDPTDNGGLFVGRRPGTAPTRYRVVPVRGAAARRRVDRLLAAGLVGVMLIVALAFWGPIPAGWLWLGGQIQHQTGSGGLAIVFSSLAILASLLAGIMLVRRLDEFWILVRRAAGYDQRRGVIGPVFATAAIVGVTLFVLWFLFFAGPGPELVGGRR